MANYINHINIGNSDYLIKDTTHPEIKFYYPTGTAAVTTSPYYCTRYDVTDAEVTAYTDGMMVWFEVPVAGNGTYGTGLQINSLGYKPIVCDTNTPIGNRYSVGSRIWCIYNSTQTATLYINSATATTVTGCWQVMDYSYESLGINDKIPYIFRATGDSNDIGDIKNEKIVGGTVAWNQLAPAVVGSTYIVNVSATDENGAITITGTASASNRNAYLSCSVIVGHKYLVLLNNKTIGSTNTGAIFVLGNYASLAEVTNKGYLMFANASYDYIRLGTGTTAGLVYDQKFIPQCFDLTQMFGATIADYIYSIEQANAGAGVAWFKKLFPKDYYPYNEGELMSVKTSKAVMTGFNAYNHTSGVAEVLAGLSYQITGTYTALSLEGESVTPDANGLFTPSKTGTLTVTGGDSNSTCVHLVWDGERNGEYVSYTTHEYPLDSSLELRGIPKLDANNKLYYDGDEYESDGKVTRRYEYRNYASGDENLADAITDGTHTVVKLATPTEETADPYTDPMMVNEWGTEEFVDTRTVAIPVGHDTFYQAGLKAKLEMAPNSPDVDGDYIVRQSGGVNEYVPYAGTSVIIREWSDS